MPALTAASVTVTLNPEDVDRSPDGRIGMRTFPVVAFGNATLTYPALGIPMPAIGKFGFNFAIKRAYIEQPANGFIYHFDRANHKVRIFQGVGHAAVTLAANTSTGNVANPAHSHSLVVLANNAGSGTGVIALEANTANHALVSNTAGGDTIPGGNTANKGGVETTTPANSTFTGDSHTHTVTGGGIIANGALAELGTGAGDAPAATTLNMEMVGR